MPDGKCVSNGAWRSLAPGSVLFGRFASRAGATQAGLVKSPQSIMRHRHPVTARNGPSMSFFRHGVLSDGFEMRHVSHFDEQSLHFE